MISYFNETDGRPMVRIKIKGSKKEKEVDAFLDTGHTGNLSLSILDLIEIGSELKAVSNVKYADNRQGTEYLFSVTVEMDGIVKEVKAGLIPSMSPSTKPLIGVQLFSPFVIFIDFKNKKIDIMKEEDFRKLLEPQKKDL